MNSNVRIARELVRIAKSISADANAFVLSEKEEDQLVKSIQRWCVKHHFTLADNLNALVIDVNIPFDKPVYRDRCITYEHHTTDDQISINLKDLSVALNNRKQDEKLDLNNVDSVLDAIVDKINDELEERYVEDQETAYLDQQDEYAELRYNGYYSFPPEEPSYDYDDSYSYDAGDWADATCDILEKASDIMKNSGWVWNEEEDSDYDDASVWNVYYNPSKTHFIIIEANYDKANLQAKMYENKENAEDGQPIEKFESEELDVWNIDNSIVMNFLRKVSRMISKY